MWKAFGAGAATEIMMENRGPRRQPGYSGGECQPLHDNETDAVEDLTSVEIRNAKEGLQIRQILSSYPVSRPVLPHFSASSFTSFSPHRFSFFFCRLQHVVMPPAILYSRSFSRISVFVLFP